MMGWQWHQLDHMQIICTSLQTDNHASTSPLSFFTGRMPFLPPNQQQQRLKASHPRGKLIGWLEFNVPFQHKYGYIRDEDKVIK